MPSAIGDPFTSFTIHSVSSGYGTSGGSGVGVLRDLAKL